MWLAKDGKGSYLKKGYGGGSLMIKVFSGGDPKLW